ncbi:MAG: GNAT family N-acetyltransferase [Isosphaeraceae bacterium]|nr:GNAT family N-acetyltransferase [Isosphaeraceae bacterium]
MTVTIRPCRPDDAETLVIMIRELATYEHLEDFARAAPEALRSHLFGSRPFAEALIAESEGQPAGFALFFGTYSTFRGQPGLYLEDIYVREELRGLGIGTALLSAVAKVALERGCGRLEWSVLDWNKPALDFYRGHGARPLDDWTVYRIDDEALTRLAKSAPGQS